MEFSGDKLGKYSIIKKLGGGGMGNVYLARDTILDRLVAIKLLTPAIAADASFVERFQLEARALARLDHRAIVRVFNADWVNDQLYLAMEYVEGGSLDKILKEDRLKPFDWSLTLLEQVAGGIDYAHRLGLVHRDIKPANILVDLNGQARITDFGLVKDAEISLTAEGQRLGTPAYMAPEQIQGADMGPPVDIYALGIVAFELFAGQIPYRGTMSAVFEGHLLREPPLIRQFNPAIPPGIQQVVRKALSKNPADRHPSAAAFVEDLREAFRLAGAGGETFIELTEDSPTARVVYQQAAAGAPGSPAPGENAVSRTRQDTIRDRPTGAQEPAGSENAPKRAGLLSRFGFGAFGIGGVLVVGLLCLCAAAAFVVYGEVFGTPTPMATEAIAAVDDTETATTVLADTPEPPTATDAVIESEETPTPTQTTAAVILYEENFDVQPSLGFPADVQPEGSLQYAHGGYLISVDSPDWAFWGLAEGTFTQTTIHVDATNQSTLEANTFGIICRYLDGNDFYYGFITSDGFYGITRWYFGEFQSLTNGPGTPDPAILPGNAVNKIRMDCDGPEIRLWVNGTQLAQAGGVADRAGDVGLIATTPLQGGVAILFDNFVVTEVEQ